MTFHILREICGWTAVFLGVLSATTQYRRAITIGVEGVSLTTWSLFAILGCFWITYGIELRSLIIVLGNLTTLPLQLAIVLRLKPWQRRYVVLRGFCFFFMSCIMPALIWGWADGIYGSSVAMVIIRGPQLIELVRHHKAAGVSVWAWMLAVTSALLWIAYYASYHLRAAYIATIFSGTMSLVIAFLAERRHRQGQNERVRDEVFGMQQIEQPEEI